MQKKPGAERALSEAVSITLILLLIVIIAVVVYLVVIGHANLAPKSAYIVCRGTAVNTSAGANTLALFHLEGDAVDLNRSVKGKGVAPVSFNLRVPSGAMETVLPYPLLSDNTWSSGDTVTIYEDGSGYWVTNDIDARIAKAGTAGPLVDLPGGNYTVNIVDRKADVLVAAVPINVTGPGTTGPQYSPGLIATYYSDMGWTTPAATTIAKRVYFADTASGRTSDVSNWPVGYVGKADYFSVKYDGYFKAETEADYTFTLSSDDGSWMDFAGSSSFISNGGLHSYASVSATKHLKPGYYPITVRMYENGGAAVVYLTYSTPSTPSAVVTQLYHLPSTAPMADFTGTPGAGSAPLSVQFTDASIDAASWSWDFGDGSGSSHAKSPVHTYTANGKYTVTLVATNSFGSSTAKKTDYITVGSFSPGLTAYYYNDQTWTSLVTTNTVNQIHFADTASGRASDVSNWPVAYTGGIADHFSAKYDGYIRIDTEDDYTFTLSSDDGSYMDLGGTTDFISNGGDHSYAPVSVTRHLVPGYYPVTVRMYENGGAAVVYLQYQTSAMSSPQLVTNVWHM